VEATGGHTREHAMLVVGDDFAFMVVVLDVVTDLLFD
jgi:hypothetical protein